MYEPKLELLKGLGFKKKTVSFRGLWIFSGMTPYGWDNQLERSRKLVV